MIKTKFENINKWYNKNLGKIVLLFLVVVFFTTSIAYIPYLNIILRSSMGILISLIVFYLLFPPPTKFLTFLCIMVLFLSYISVVLRVNFILDWLGSLIFLLLIFMITNFANDLHKREKQ